MLNDGPSLTLTSHTMQGLEKAPLTKIAAEPIELLDKTRYQFCRKQLTCEKEDRLNIVLSEMASRAAKRGILVKPFFEDASRDPNSVRMINHVTPQQFKQVGSFVKLADSNLTKSLRRMLNCFGFLCLPWCSAVYGLYAPGYLLMLGYSLDCEFPAVR